MKDSIYRKRTQKDYTLSFKLQVVQEIESGQISRTAAADKYGIQAKSTIREWLKKYGNFDWVNRSANQMEKTPERKLLELEQKVKLLEKKNARLEAERDTADKKAIIFDMMIDLAEEEYKISIRKNSSPEQSTPSARRKKKA